MSQITKYRCDHCLKEVEDTYLEDGWIKVSGSITRSWGMRKDSGNPETDYLGKDSEFCSVECLVAAFDKVRAERRGPVVVKRVRPPKERTAFDLLEEEEGT